MCCIFRFSGFATSEGVVVGASKRGIIVGSPTIASGVGMFIGSSVINKGA